jgi:hypothetical protein
VELALRLHRLEEFMIVEVTEPLSRSAPACEPGRAADRNACGRWLADPPRVARTLCGEPGGTCCRRSGALPGQMSRKRASCSATWPLPSKRAADSTSLDELRAQPAQVIRAAVLPCGGSVSSWNDVGFFAQYGRLISGGVGIS